MAGDIFRLVFDNAPDGIFLADAGGRFVEANPAACRMSGYLRDELLARSIPDLLPPEGLEAGLAAFGQAKAEGRFAGELSVRVKSGEIRWWAIDAVKISEDRFMGFMKDVTARREAEEALFRSGRNYRQLAENLPHGVFIHRGGRVVYANRAFGALMGAADARELIGLDPVGELLDPEFVPLVAERMALVRATGAAATPLALRLRRLDGGLVEVESIGVAVDFAGDGAIMAVVTDVTARNEAGRALAASERTFRDIMEHSPVGLIVAIRGEIVYANPAFCRLIKARSPDEVLGLTIEDVVAAEFLQSAREREKETLADGALLPHREIRIRRRDGLETEVETSIVRIDYHGSPAILISLVDVAARARLERELREAAFRFSSVVENMQDSYLRADLAGTITEASPSVASHLGYGSVREIIGSDMSLIYAFPEERERILRLIRQNGAVRDEVVRCRKKDGEICWVSLTAYLVRDPTGVVTGTEGIARDVTARVRAGEEAEKDRRRLSVALEAAGMGVTEYDIENDALVWDEKVFELWGFKGRDQPRFGEALDRIHPEDRDRVVEAIERGVDPAGDGRVHIRFRVVGEDGRTLRRLESYGRTFFTDGRPVVHYGTHREIPAADP